ncbi:pseudouridine synthase 7 [Brevipalpus obovatus]|uniref:pseudouridine synthase 7 n=1 Tax=Brevipalpus obovatus TaxID=246614 RepID=UPI003D9E4705
MSFHDHVYASTIKPSQDHAYACKRIKLDDVKSSVDYKQWKVSEEDVGITEFLHHHTGFTGTIKHRCHDFIVHEVLNGQLVRLTDLNSPPQFKEPEKEPEEKSSHITTELHEKLTQLSLRRNAPVGNEASESDHLEIDAGTLSKEERKSVHAYVRENFKNLESNYEDRDGRKVILVARKGHSSRKNFQPWPSHLADNVHFTLFHVFQGTFEAIDRVAKFCGRPTKCFSYAGTKDKRSISSQRVSVYRQNVDNLIKLNNFLGNHRNPILVGNITFEKEALSLGCADGNRFDIVIRNIICDRDEDIIVGVENIKEKGFINYFGTQRFGMNNSPTHRIGVAVLRRNWLEVVDLILSERDIDYVCPRSKKSYNECMRVWKETRDPDLVLKSFSFKDRLEGKLLKSLSSSPNKNNYFQGFQSIPRNQRLIYLHAYQSFLWNKLASFRIKEFGLSVVAGDLVIPRSTELSDNLSIKHPEPLIVSLHQVNDFTIFDVVLPILGSSSILPDNTVKDKLMELLQEDDFDLSSFETEWKEMSLYGSYRYLLGKPLDVEVEIVSYDDDEDRLFLTDLDILRGNELPPSIGSKKAAKLSFTLPSSTYATVLLRELFRKSLHTAEKP